MQIPGVPSRFTMFDETVLQSVLCTPSGVLRYVIETADLDDVLEVGQTDWTPNLKVHRFTHLCTMFPQHASTSLAHGQQHGRTYYC